MSHMLHSSLCGSLFATPCRYEICCILLEHSQQKRPPVYTQVFSSRDLNCDLQTLESLQHIVCLEWVACKDCASCSYRRRGALMPSYILHLLPPVFFAVKSQKKSSGPQVIDVIVMQGMFQGMHFKLLWLYSFLSSTRIFPTTTIISAAFAPRVSGIWHVFIVYMDWIICPIKW